jgi:hypothetical protein
VPVDALALKNKTVAARPPEIANARPDRVPRARGVARNGVE